MKPRTHRKPIQAFVTLLEQRRQRYGVIWPRGPGGGRNYTTWRIHPSLSLALSLSSFCVFQWKCVTIEWYGIVWSKGQRSKTGEEEKRVRSNSWLCPKALTPAAKDRGQ